MTPLPTGPPVARLLPLFGDVEVVEAGQRAETRVRVLVVAAAVLLGAERETAVAAAAAALLAARRRTEQVELVPALVGGETCA